LWFIRPNTGYPQPQSLNKVVLYSKKTFEINWLGHHLKPVCTDNTSQKPDRSLPTSARLFDQN
jgi:hypothetical protein